MDRLVPDVAAPGVSILPYVLGLTGVSRHRLPGENPKDGVAPMSDGASGPGARIARAAAIRERSGCPALSKTMTARELKNRTGDALRAVGQGEQVLITRRGKPFALVVPATAAPRESEDDALLETLRVNARRRPLPFSSYEEFRAWSRGLSSSTRARSSSTSRSRKTRARD